MPELVITPKAGLVNKYIVQVTFNFVMEVNGPGGDEAIKRGILRDLTVAAALAPHLREITINTTPINEELLREMGAHTS